MASHTDNEQVIAELRKLKEAASLQRVKDILQREIDRITAESSHRVAPGVPEPTTAPRNTAAASPAVVVKEIVTYGYDDDDDEYTIVVTQNMENVTKEGVSCQFTPQSFVLNVRISGEGAAPITEHRLEVRNLFGEIDPAKSRARAGKKQVIITLKKVHSHAWDALTKVEHSLKEKSKPNYNKKKRDTDNAEDPSAGLMSLMRDMYEQGDDQMKQTIAKAMYESRQKNAAAPDLQ